MKNVSTPRRLTLALAGTLLAAGAAMTAGPAQAASMVTVPPGCGKYSGTLVPANQLDDHSADSGPLGSASSHYKASLTVDMITVGTAFDDYIDGNDGVDDVICGLQGDDDLSGFGNNDTLFGDKDDDTLSGGANADTLFGGDGSDHLFGDDVFNSNGTNDQNDDLHGDVGKDFLYGGAGKDTIGGGKGADTGDGQADGGTCDPTNVETRTNC